MRPAPDPATRWVKAVAPDDDYLPPAEPEAAAWQVSETARGRRSTDEPEQGSEGLGPERVALIEDKIPRRSRIPNAPSDDRSLRDRTGFDGRIATALGRLAPEEFRAARRARRIDGAGNLMVRAVPTTTRTARGRDGRKRSVTATFTLEEYLEAQERHRLAEEAAAQHRAAAKEQHQPPPAVSDPSRQLRFAVRPDWVRPRFYEDGTIWVLARSCGFRVAGACRRSNR